MSGDLGCSGLCIGGISIPRFVCRPGLMQGHADQKRKRRFVGFGLMPGSGWTALEGRWDVSDPQYVFGEIFGVQQDCGGDKPFEVLANLTSGWASDMWGLVTRAVLDCALGQR